MRRKKSFRSTSFRFTEIGSPVYFAPAGAGCCVRCVFCSAARLTAASLLAGVAEGSSSLRAAFVGVLKPSIGFSENFAAASRARAGAASGAVSGFFEETSVLPTGSMKTVSGAMSEDLAVTFLTGADTALTGAETAFTRAGTVLVANGEEDVLGDGTLETASCLTEALGPGAASLVA